MVPKGGVRGKRCPESVSTGVGRPESSGLGVGGSKGPGTAPRVLSRSIVQHGRRAGVAPSLKDK